MLPTNYKTKPNQTKPTNVAMSIQAKLGLSNLVKQPGLEKDTDFITWQEFFGESVRH